MKEVKAPLEVSFLDKKGILTALRNCLDLTLCPGDVPVHYIHGYRECLKDFRLIGCSREKADITEPGEVILIEKDMLIRNLTKYIILIQDGEEESKGYLKCLRDLGLIDLEGENKHESYSGN